MLELTSDIQTVQEVISTFGEPDLRLDVGLASTTPEQDGKPETTKSYPAMIYSNLSKFAEVIYPTERVEFWFSAKAVKNGPS